MRRGDRRQDGFTIIEVLVSIAILAIVAGGVAQGLALASSRLGESRIESKATALASSELDQAHAMPYGDVGTVAGNPPGTIPATRTETVDGRDFTVATDVVFVDDAAAGQPQTGIDYKRVRVTVTPEGQDADRAVTQTTIVAPPAFGAVQGKATVTATVTDPFTATPTLLTDVPVTLDGSTSAARTALTDDLGAVAFPGLEPSADDPASPQYAYRLSTSLAGYVVRTPADQLQKNLAASERWGPVPIEVFKPATILVNLRDSVTGLLIARNATATVTTPGSPALTASQYDDTGQFTFSQIAGAPIEPSRSSFTVAASLPCYTGASAQRAVPVGYPTSTSETFNLSLVPVQALLPLSGGELSVQVVRQGTSTPLAGATVTLGGLNARTTDANGIVRYCLSAASGIVSRATLGGYGAGTLPTAVTNDGVTSLRLELVPAAPTTTVRVTLPSPNRRVRLVAALGTYDLTATTGTTNNPRRVDFTGLAPGTYTCQYDTTGASTGTPVWSAAKSVSAVVGATSACVLP